MINKYLDASTGYITKKDSEKLNDSSFVHAIPYAYSWWIYVENTDSNFWGEDCDMSDSFIKLVWYALNNDCTWIKLDCDGDDTIDELEFNEW